MAEIIPPDRFSGPTTEEALLADRMRFWGNFTRFVTVSAIVVVIVLIMMAAFLIT